MNIVELESQEKVKELYLKTIGHLINNPPTVGHGFSHFVKVARGSCALAEANDCFDPLTAYACGLLHDVYRPAMGQAGQEDHGEKAAKIAGEILLQVGLADIANTVISAIGDHDKKIISGEADLLMKILSVADKKDMSFQRVIAYIWQSNQFLKKIGQPIFTSFLEIMRDFTHYQVKAWKIFLQTEDITGQNLAVQAYLFTNRNLLDAIEGKLEGRLVFADEVLRLSKQEAQLDRKFLKEFGATEEQIRQITSQYDELF